MTINERFKQDNKKAKNKIGQIDVNEINDTI